MFKHFEEILSNAGLDIQTEYQRLYTLFFEEKSIKIEYSQITLHELCRLHFRGYKFKGTCINLLDFEQTHNFLYDKSYKCNNIEQFALFCEYICNMLLPLEKIMDYEARSNCRKGIDYCLNQIAVVMEKVGYCCCGKKDLLMFVPRDANAIAVAEAISDKTKLSYRVIEYNHSSLKGNLFEKRSIIGLLAHLLEAEKLQLQKLDRKLADMLFNAFNNLNIRHNNLDGNGNTKYKPFVANMSDQEMENCYDDIYQLCLQAFIMIDNVERRVRLQNILDSVTKSSQAE